MTEHPITPPPELVQQWIQEATGSDYEQRIATQAARWGSDQELEACCEWVDYHCSKDTSLDLCAARRPKPPSLKEQALAKLPEHPEDMTPSQYWELTSSEVTIIRRALEQLPDE